MVDPVEAFFDVCFQHVFRFEPDVVEDGFDGILWTAPRPEPVTVGFKAGFPLWFEGQFDQGLFGPVSHDGYSKRSSFVWIAGFRDVDPADGCGSQTEIEQLFHHPHPLTWRETGYPIHAGGVLSPIVL